MGGLGPSGENGIKLAGDTPDPPSRYDTTPDGALLVSIRPDSGSAPVGILTMGTSRVHEIHSRYMEADHTGIQALIVDDEADICALLSYVLNKNHIHSNAVTSIREAKKALERGLPDVMLLDNHLSDGLGVDFIPFVRAHHPSVRIIMITAFDGTEEKDKAMARGASAFISKPFSQDDILEAVRDLNA